MEYIPREKDENRSNTSKIEPPIGIETITGITTTVNRS